MAVVLVTGGNRGLGLGIVHAIGSRLPSSTVLIGCRSIPSGKEAVQQLKGFSLSATFDTVQIDIEDDASISSAVSDVEKRYGKLDVLINNAARVEMPQSADLAEIRTKSNLVYNSCITSPAIVTKAFTPLLRKSDSPKVIMVSSARGSVGRTASKQLPPVALVDYCVAKAAMNMLTLHLSLAEDKLPEKERISFWAVSPGHIKTAFNGYRGTKDPVDGAEVVVRLLESGRGDVQSGTFWEFENGEFRSVPW